MSVNLDRRGFVGTAAADDWRAQAVPKAPDLPSDALFTISVIRELRLCDLGGDCGSGGFHQLLLDMRVSVG